MTFFIALYNLKFSQDDGSPVSVFIFDSNQPPRRNLLPLAKNALRKLRTVRHPDVVRFIDTVDSESIVYIMTERVRPLGQVLQTWSSKSAKEREEWNTWGLQRISVSMHPVYAIGLTCDLDSSGIRK